ncbi:MAG: GPW/gp25 family protein [Chloroflexi bacterium]|nr:GPW/gp25 family protein [Chloroflexota bacterium]
MAGDIIGRGWTFPPRLDERGQVAMVGGEVEIEQAVRIILGTSPGQRVMRPEFGCRLQELVFAPNNSRTAGLAERYVREALGRWEPRIRVTAVSVSTDNQHEGQLSIGVEYLIKATHSSRSLVYPFYLIPEE